MKHLMECVCSREDIRTVGLAVFFGRQISADTNEVIDRGVRWGLEQFGT